MARVFVVVKVKLKTRVCPAVEVCAGGSAPNVRLGRLAVWVAGVIVIPMGTVGKVTVSTLPLVGTGVFENPVSSVTLVKADAKFSVTLTLNPVGAGLHVRNPGLAAVTATVVEAPLNTVATGTVVEPRKVMGLVEVTEAGT
jgi:hypothetical protein